MGRPPGGWGEAGLLVAVIMNGMYKRMKYA